MSFFNFLDIKFLNKNIVILLAFGIILLMAADLRFYNLSKVYTEYDDIGVLTLHKSKAGVRKGDYKFELYNKTFSVNWETLRNLEDSFLYPLFVGFAWTYSPGQYFLYPLILSDDDNYEMKVIKGRFISAFSSVATILLLFLFFVSLNKGLSWAVLFPISILAFSQNSILYAHHMSPYSMYGLATTAGLILIYLGAEKKVTTYNCCLFNTILMYFSYTNLLFFLPLLYIEYHRQNLKEFIFSYFGEKKKLLLINLLLLFPVFILLLQKLLIGGNISADRGFAVRLGGDFISTIKFPFIILKQLYIASQSVFMGFFPTGYPIAFLLLFFIVFITVAYWGVNRKQTDRKIFLSGLILFILQWLFLYAFSKLPLDQTRHSLIWFPVILSMMFLCFNYFKLPNLFYVALCLIFIPYSYVNAKNLVSEKTSNLDYEFIENQNVEHIFLYSFTEGPLLYFEDKKTVLNVDVNSFRVAYDKSKMPEKFLLVSQDRSLESYKSNLQGRFPEMFSEYKNETLVEKSTGQYFPYNNYMAVSQQNGFYVYLFTRVEN
jgi:hypothetical protein